MATYDDSKYLICELRSLPAGIFGETYAVVTGIHTSGSYFKGEYFVLTQRPAAALQKGGFRFSSTDVPADLLTVDLDFMIQEARQQAEILLIDRLEERATQLQRPELLGLNIQMKECSARPFVGCWLRGQFHEQLLDIRDQTECASLASYLGLVSQLKTFKG
jgi:hypothetical protein